MSARDSILAAIRAAAVPAAPPAQTPAPRTADIDDLHRDFLRVLTEVGGQGVFRTTGQPMESFIAELLGAERDDVIVLRGRFAVAENAAVYVDAADLDARNDIVRAEHLVVIVPFSAIVPTMHEAMRLMPADSGCGWFLSGPSKTADIEQSLVFGAQGSRTHRVIFDRDT
ncbi:MAG: LUD domain-containing protein [Gemmatimonadaceae bacterium]